MNTVWITKYALTTGIITAETEDNISSSVISVHERGFSDCLYLKKDWHTTEKDAKIQADQLRNKKIVSLKKQIKRLEALEF